MSTIKSELDELLIGSLDAALTKYMVRQFEVLMSDPTDAGTDRFMLGLSLAVWQYLKLRPLIVAIDDEPPAPEV